jgi:hypothetical protein
MTLQSDASFGFKKETTYGTLVTVDRWVELNSQSMQQKNEFLQGEGLRVGKLTGRIARRSLGKFVVEGDLEMDAATKGMGTLFELMFGTGTSTLRSGVIYQQLFTPATTDPMPCASIQTGVPPVGGGSTLAHTFSGCVVDSWEISAEAGGGVELKCMFVGKEMVTATAYAAPSYSANSRIFTFTHGAISLGENGTHALTVPTTTALGSTAAAANAMITKISVQGDNAVDDGGYTLGSAGKRGRRPVYGPRSWKGSMTAEVQAATLRDYYLSQTSLQLVLTFVSDDLINGSTYATLQIVIPALVLEGEVPTVGGNELITQEIEFTVLDGESAASPIYAVLVTADSAL